MKNWASDNEGKFHIFLKCRIWICNKKFNFSLDIRVSVNLAFFEKIGLFLSTLALATLVKKTEAQFCNQCCQYKSAQKAPKIVQFSKTNAKFMLTLMSKEKLNFLLQIQILHFKYVWTLPSLSLARFFLIQNELQTMCGQGRVTISRRMALSELLSSIISESKSLEIPYM